MKFAPWKYTFLPVLFLLALSLTAALAEPQYADSPETQPGKDSPLTYVDVSESVVMVHNPKLLGSNMICLAIGDGLLFVDCGLFTERAATFRRDMENRFNKKTAGLLLTHAHTDHFFGMGAFADVTVYAAKAEKPLFEAKMNVDFHARVENYKRIFPLFGEALKTARPFLPTQWFEEEAAVGSGKHQVVMRRTGGHTAGSAYALLPTEGALVAGDNVQVDYHPYFGDQTGNMSVWIETLQAWEDMDIKNVCPGHGPVADKAYLTAMRTYYQDLMAVLTKLKTDGASVRDAVFHPDLPEGYWPKELEKPAWFNPSVAGVYRAIEVDQTAGD